jgi:hypothetical protein
MARPADQSLPLKPSPVPCSRSAASSEEAVIEGGAEAERAEQRALHLQRVKSNIGSMHDIAMDVLDFAAGLYIHIWIGSN